MKLTYKDWMLEYLVEWDVLFVLSLYVEQDRRQGTATKLMNMLLEEAKELDVDVIEFSAMSFDVEDWMLTEELKDWYERLWFECIESYSIWANKWYVMKMEM
jgi:ribosomal protein S18 acetylase RimI-like enzyme